MKKILVIEDNSDLRMGYGILLNQAGYQTFLTSNGLIALAVLAIEEIDLIISVGAMPRMSGYAVLQSVRATPMTCLIPFILVTASISDHSHEISSEVLPDMLLEKPFEIDTLLQGIDTLLEQAFARKQHQ